MLLKLPDYVKHIIATLESGGYEAYAVGGCVRDALLGLTPDDYDITTSATPDEMKSVFGERGFTVHDTGLKHGTVTVIVSAGGTPAEVTTFRIDGDYTDNRRPDSVTFTKSLREDLSRRDFTVNAMAYSEKTGIADYFGGRADLENKLIRAVGEPSKRFNEDGLRILRALRFAATYGFTIEDDTAAAIHDLRGLIRNISGERIAQELNKLVMGEVGGIIWDYADVFAEFIPEIAACKGFDQRSGYHNRDVLTHTLAAMDYSNPDKVTRLALLFHDLGKPEKFTLRPNGDGSGGFHGSFKGHAAVSAEIARRIMRQLKYDNDTLHKVVTLVRYHNIPLKADKKSVKRLLNRFSDLVFRLIDVHIADDSAKVAKVGEERIPTARKAAALAERIILKGDCFSLKQLAVKGGDLVQLGYKGKKVGETLNVLLQAVISERCVNSKDELLDYLKKLKKGS